MAEAHKVPFVGMSGFPSGNPWTEIKRDLKRRGRGQIVAAVAYVGVDGPEVMPLRQGDLLICDASPRAVKSRSTSAAALRRYHKIGVAIFSVSALHAKAIAGSDFAWVGSTNASKNSETDLIEAAVRVTGTQARKVREWILHLGTTDRELSLEDIAALARIPLDPPRQLPRREPTPPRSLPAVLAKLRFVEVDPPTVAQEQSAEGQRSSAKLAARAQGLPSALRWLYWEGGASPRKGDWIVELVRGHVRRPAVVVRVSKVGADQVLWLSEVRTPKRPNSPELREALPELQLGFVEFTAKSPEQIRRARRLFGM